MPASVHGVTRFGVTNDNINRIRRHETWKEA